MIIDIKVVLDQGDCLHSYINGVKVQVIKDIGLSKFILEAYPFRFRLPNKDLMEVGFDPV